MGSGRIFTLLAIEASSPLSIDLTTTSGCETILQPGFNSTVQIGKNRSKHWGKHKHNIDIYFVDGPATPSSVMPQPQKRKSKKALETASIPAKAEASQNSAQQGKNGKDLGLA
ncbi:hypothetical protein AHAS_Ahas05G0073400 [Arachis hypogaea]|uniref:Uncharacterized protein n=1 Tax=Arachis hypogaea TaxID=3818 RepID=A0A445D8R1_ARAHY|nr:hypothetical protein Ahy_A05g025455 [Arachis hypogaea]